MPSSASAAIIAEANGQHRLHHTVDLTLAGTTYRFAKREPVEHSDGTYSPYLERLGVLRRSIAFPSLLGLQNPRVAVPLRDAERQFQKAAGGPAAGKVVGSAANVVLRSFYVDAADHYTKLPGEIKDYEQTGDLLWSIVLGPNETPLSSKLKIPRLSKDDWPEIPVENRDRPGVMVWGEWDSTDRKATGLVPTYLVEPSSQYWYVSYGHFPDNSITVVYVDGAADTANFTMRRILRNGRPYTVLEQTSGTAYTIANTITVDCTGLGTSGDGAGIAEREPGDVLKIMLANVVFGDFPIGALPGLGTDPGYRWLVNTTNIDSTSLTDVDAFLSVLNHEHARFYTSDQTGFDLLSIWMRTFRCPLFWSDEFKLKVGFFEFFKKNIYDVDVEIRQDLRDVIGEISGRTFGEDRISQAEVSYMFDPVANDFDRKFLAANADVPFVREVALEYTAGGPSALDIG